MKNLALIFLALFLTAPCFAQKYVLSHDVDLKIFKKEELKKLTKKQRLVYLDIVRKTIQAVAEKPKKKTFGFDIDFSFLNSAYAQDSVTSFCIDYAGWPRVRDGENCPAPQTLSCPNTGQVRCAPIYGENVCVPASNAIQTCENRFCNFSNEGANRVCSPTARAIPWIQNTQTHMRRRSTESRTQYEDYDGAWAFRAISEGDRRLAGVDTLEEYGRLLRGVCDADRRGHDANLCERIYTHYTLFRNEEAVRGNIPYPEPQAVLSVTNNEDIADQPAPDIEDVITISPDATNRNRTATSVDVQPARGSSGSPIQRTPVPPSSANRDIERPLPQMSNESQIPVGSGEPAESAAPAEPATQADPAAPAGRQASGSGNFNGNEICNTAVLTTPVTYQGRQHRESLLPIETVKRIFCSRAEVSDQEFRDLSFQLMERKRNLTRGSRGDVEGIQQHLQRCIDAKKAGRFPIAFANANVNVSCDQSQPTRVCTMTGVSEVPNGYNRAVTDENSLSLMLRLNAWQWCQVSNYPEAGRSAPPAGSDSPSRDGGAAIQ